RSEAMMNGAQALVELLAGCESQVIFGLPGDTSVDLYDALPPATPPPDHDGWLAGIARDKAAWRAQVEHTPARAHGRFHPRWVIQELQRVLPPDAVLIADPGTPTPYLSAGFELRQAGRWAITPRAQGGLGCAIPGG
ncbi:MAG: hypothetical protein PVJ23_08015, partial [Anaerolineae bacterium]